MVMWPLIITLLALLALLFFLWSRADNKGRKLAARVRQLEALVKRYEPLIHKQEAGEATAPALLPPAALVKAMWDFVAAVNAEQAKRAQPAPESAERPVETPLPPGPAREPRKAAKPVTNSKTAKKPTVKKGA